MNNNEFSNLPSVRTLDGVSFQGNYIRMMQRCKQFLETLYLAGAIMERAVYQSGSKAKSNGQQTERKLLWEVMELVLGDCMQLRIDMSRYVTSFRNKSPGP
jgi:hypothetical protein